MSILDFLEIFTTIVKINGMILDKVDKKYQFTK